MARIQVNDHQILRIQLNDHQILSFCTSDAKNFVTLQQHDEIYSNNLVSSEQAQQSSSKRIKLNSEKKDGCKQSAAQLRNFIAEIHDIGWDCVASVTNSFDELVLQVEDKAGRIHRLRYNLVTRECSSDSLRLSIPKRASLSEAKEQFERQLETHHQIWDELDEMDRRYAVLDPTLPVPRSILRRRLAVTTHASGMSSTVSIEIRMTMGHPNRTRPCTIDVIGPTIEAEPWRERLQRIAWDISLSISENINKCCKDIGALALKSHCSKVESNEAPTAPIECGICYTYRTQTAGEDAELPDQSCGECRKPYHRSCLLGWLQVLPTSKHVFKVLVGDCPYCGKSVSLSTS